MFRQDPNAIEVEWRNKLIWGDNKYVMNALLEKYAGQIDLIYIDPPHLSVSPFMTKSRKPQQSTRSTVWRQNSRIASAR